MIMSHLDDCALQVSLPIKMNPLLADEYSIPEPFPELPTLGKGTSPPSDPCKKERVSIIVSKLDFAKLCTIVPLDSDLLVTLKTRLYIGFPSTHVDPVLVSAYE